jgi:exodeoxyribonuclease V alpha subunit
MSSVKIHGVVKRLTFVNEANGYFVAVLDIPGIGERAVKGSAPTINIGEHMAAVGVWERTAWGTQFKASQVQLSAPRQLGEIEKYLASAIDGIGPGFAKKLVAAFGEDIFSVIENSPARLKEIKGVGKKRLDSVVAAYNENKALRDIMLFLHKSGLGPGRAKRVYETFGDKAIKMIQKNPYVLCKDVWGIGFTTADEVAKKQGIDPLSEFRIRAGIQHILRMSEANGSCGIPMESKKDALGRVVVGRDGKPKEPGLVDGACLLMDVPEDVVRKCIQYEIDAGDVFEDEDGEGFPCLFSKKIYLSEQAIANYFIDASKRVPERKVSNLDEAILDIELEIGLILEDSQRSALRTALNSQVCIITGGPGCGKTTITNVLLRVLRDQGFTTVLAAPTGKAAKRAAEATGHEAGTVHRAYEYGKEGKFGVNAKNPLNADVLVLDETSMLDVYMTRTVLNGLSAGTRLIFIGDVDQLPSVGPGKVLSDLIESGVVPTARLTAVFRQANNSAIIRNAHRINKGVLPDLGYYENSDFVFFNFQPNDRKDEDEKRKVRETMRDELVRMCRDMYKRGFDPVRDVQVYAPMRKGILGIEELNLALQRVLNPRPEQVLEVYGVKWGVGDKVMQLKNNRQKQVFNGNVGFVAEIDKESRSLVVQFDDQVVTYKNNELDELTLAYAITIHKSQGSESPVVLIPMDYSHYTMLKRNLLYTGVTRAKKLCVLLGDRDAIRYAVENNQNDDRHTRLKRLLRQQVTAEVLDEEYAMS